MNTETEKQARKCYGQMVIDSIKWRIRVSLGYEVMGVFFGEKIITFKPRVDSRPISFSVNSVLMAGGVADAVTAAELSGNYSDAEIKSFGFIIDELVRSNAKD